MTEFIVRNFEILELIATGIVGFIVWILGKDRATNKRIDRLFNDLDRKIGRHEERITRLEMRLDKKPKWDDINDIQNSLGAMAQQLARLETSVQLITQHVERVK